MKHSQEIVFSGKLFNVVQSPQPDGRVFERAVRAPGVRVIIADTQARKLLLTKEFREELGAWDYRLPGGKVFDSLAEFTDFDGDIMARAEQKVLEESHEEAGIEVDSVELFQKSVLGATVEWDLYVFVAGPWRKAKSQQLEPGEQIETGNWFSFSEAEAMILNGQMQEERIGLILLRWLKEQY